MSILDDTYAGFVNMDQRTDRLERMKYTLGKAHITAERVRGPRPDEWAGDPARVKVMQNRTPGAIGCYMGQVQVMAEAVKRSQHAFVMEDDLIVCSDFHARLEIIEDFLSSHEWDVFWFGGTFHVNPPAWWPERDIELTEHPRIVRTYGAFSTHAYLVNARSVESVLDLLDGMLVRSMGIDWSMIQMQPYLQTFAFVPGCIIQYDNYSDIGRGITEFSHFASLGPYWYADRMEEFDPATFDWAEARVS